MNVRVALSWLYDRLVTGYAAQIAADEDDHLRKARDKADRQHREALATVDDLLEAPEGGVATDGPSVERAEWFRAMGVEVAS